MLATCQGLHRLVTFTSRVFFARVFFMWECFLRGCFAVLASGFCSVVRHVFAVHFSGEGLAFATVRRRRLSL